MSSSVMEYAYNKDADHLQGTDEIQDEETIFSWEKQTQVMTKLRT